MMTEILQKNDLLHKLSRVFLQKYISRSKKEVYGIQKIKKSLISCKVE